MPTLKFPHIDDLWTYDLADERLREYDWATRVRVTYTGEKIDDIWDVLAVSTHEADGEHLTWHQDALGQYVHLHEDDIDDERHPSVRRFDERLWEAMVGTHSPRDEVRHAARTATAADIALNLMRAYPTGTLAVCTEEHVTREELHDSLRRTLLIDGGARA
jgi:hypothetical protein